MDNHQKLTRIGVFYDGNYFYHVSNYYNYSHERKSRLNIKGLHEFIRRSVADYEGGEERFRHCQIVDAHYFRDRLNARDASNKGNLLYYDRVFDDILMSEGVTTHYLPIKSSNGRMEEKGIDVWLALEAFELALYKKFDVLVLIACDGDFVPLIRKLNTLGTRVMLLSWDFEYYDENDNYRITRTSQQLMEEVTYPMAMHEIINNASIQDNGSLISSLFVPSSNSRSEDSEVMRPFRNISLEHIEVEEGYEVNEILSLKEGFGFIRKPPNNIFFVHSNLKNIDFDELSVGDLLKYKVDVNDRNQEIAIDIEMYENQN